MPADAFAGPNFNPPQPRSRTYSRPGGVYLAPGEVHPVKALLPASPAPSSVSVAVGVAVGPPQLAR